MTVAIGIETPAKPKPSHALPLLHNRTNKRWPPMANRNTLPYKLTLISKEKLAREATAPNPCLRRCVAHFRLHCGSIQWTENDMKSRISSFEFEETDEEDEGNGPEEPKKTEPSQTQETENLVEIKITETTTPESNAASSPSTSPSSTSSSSSSTSSSSSSSSSSSPPPSPQLSPENGFLDKSRNCIEITSKNFCCISVPPLVG